MQLITAVVASFAVLALADPNPRPTIRAISPPRNISMTRTTTHPTSTSTSVHTVTPPTPTHSGNPGAGSHLYMDTAALVAGLGLGFAAFL